MDNIHLPPEIAAHVRAIADATHRDVQAVAEELLRDGLKTARKRAFDQELHENYEAGLRGEVISAAESLATLDDE